MNDRKQFLMILFLILGVYFSAGAQRRFQDIDRQIERFTFSKSIFFNYELYPFATENPDSFRTFLNVSLVNDLLQFVKRSDSLYVAKFELSYSILQGDRHLIRSGTSRQQLIVHDFSTTNSRAIVHNYFHTFPLDTGKYKLLLELTDLDTRKSLKREKDFELKPVDSKPIVFLKPIVLTRSIPKTMTFAPLRDGEKSILSDRFANSMRFIPSFQIRELPHFRITTPVIVYFEIYQIQPGDSIQIEYRLVDRENQVKWKQQASLFSRKLHKLSHSVNLNPEDFPPGYYNFQILANKDGGRAEKQIGFYLTHKRRREMTTNPEDETTKIDEFGPLKYIIDSDLYDSWRAFSPGARDSAIERFWAERNPNQEGENKLRREFLRRVRFANQNFISLIQNNPGWQTDQGRIYIVYGPPDEILHPQSPDTQYHHEIWIYHHLQPNRRFLFVFKSEEGEYVLMRVE